MNKQIILESVFIRCALGTIYKMAPYNKPRNPEQIVDDIHKYFAEHGKQCLGSYFIVVDTAKRYELVDKVMKSSKAFIDLNLSQEEVDRGIAVDNPDRPPFTCVSRDMTIRAYYDFIDLDACIRNINEQLYYDWLDQELMEERLEIVPVTKEKS